MRIWPTIIALFFAACSTTAADIQSPAYLVSEHASPKPVAAFADCVHGRWQTNVLGQINRAPLDGSVLLTFWGNEYVGTTVAVRIDPAQQGSMTSVYARITDEGAGDAIAACIS